jgi:hypothetical protein
MRTPPGWATGLLLRLGPDDESFLGDLVEEYESGRSRAWYWRQVVAAVLLTCWRQAGSHPLRTLLGVASGWATLLLVFLVPGDTSAEGLAGWLWGWDRQTAYATRLWWPFWITAALVSYAGFAFSALVVVRLHRRHAGPMLLAYAMSVALVLVASAAIIELLSARHGGVPLPHALFYVVSVALPYHWRAGVLLAPAIVLAAGIVGCSPGRSRLPAAGQSRSNREPR